MRDPETDAPLVEAAVLAALGRRDELREHLRTALAEGAAEPELRESLLQVHPYAGFPRALSALEILADVRARSADPVEPEPDGDDAARRDRGRSVFDAVWGEHAPGILERMRAWHPELPTWILTDAYGRVLARPGLDLATREVLGVALLAALDQPIQLQGHLRGGLRTGATAERLRAAVARACRHVPPAAAGRARTRVERELGPFPPPRD
jgi:4-carboxymuconolactone decarboxylase